MQVEQQTPRRVDEQKIEVLADSHFKLERHTLQIESYAGQMAPTMKREVLRSGRSVAILLYDPVADKVILTEQFRIGAYLNRIESPWLIECVAGMVDEGETPDVSARREVQEETGCVVHQMEQIGAYLTSPGITDELATLFVGRVDAAAAGGIHGKASEAEDIRTLVMSRDDALAAADRGDVVNIVAQLALLWLGGHGAALRQRWLADGV